MEPKKESFYNKEGDLTYYQRRTREDYHYKSLAEVYRLLMSFVMVFLGKTYDVSPYDSQRSHPLFDLGVKWN